MTPVVCIFASVGAVMFAERLKVFVDVLLLKPGRQNWIGPADG